MGRSVLAGTASVWKPVAIRHRSRPALLLVLLLLASACGGGGPSDDDIAGVWRGDLIEGVEIQFRCERGAEGALECLLDSITEGVMGLEMDTQADTPGHAELSLSDGLVVVVLDLGSDGETVSGTWEQAGQLVAFQAERQEEAFTYERPQEPQPPFPYLVEEVAFTHPDGGFTIAGTLTVPEGGGPFIGAVLVSGSGQQDRDEQLLGHRPFLVLADALTRAGVAVLRYDDRGVGGTGGDPLTGTTEDFATDAAAAVEYLASRPEVDEAAVGIVGHSEGGLIGPMVADRHGSIAWLVLLAGPGVNGREIMILQSQRAMALAGADPDAAAWWTGVMTEITAIAVGDLNDTRAEAAIRTHITEALDSAPEGAIEETGVGEIMALPEEFTTPWMRAFLRLEPGGALGRLDVPVLALLGGLDFQVPPDQNEPALRAALETSASPDWEVVVMESHNHLFQNAETGALSEYAEISETLSAEVLDLVATWILEHARAAGGAGG
jgi:pimeloyl-ACP methyl ester carboxylesterase